MPGPLQQEPPRSKGHAWSSRWVSRKFLTLSTLAALPRPDAPLFAPFQALPVNSLPFKGMDLDGAHQEDCTVATFGPRCWTMWVSNCNFWDILTSIFLLWSTPLIPCLLSADCFDLFTFIIHIRIKTSAHTHHISLAAVVIVAKKFYVKNSRQLYGCYLRW
jgi:hypothetical protein